MARRGRPTAEITLSSDERETLRRWARRHRSSQALALRCRIVLAAAEGRTNTDKAAFRRTRLPSPISLASGGPWARLQATVRSRRCRFLATDPGRMAKWTWPSSSTVTTRTTARA